jgi:hypothetical protein
VKGPPPKVLYYLLDGQQPAPLSQVRAYPEFLNFTISFMTNSTSMVEVLVCGSVWVSVLFDVESLIPSSCASFLPEATTEVAREPRGKFALRLVIYHNNNIHNLQYIHTTYKRTLKLLQQLNTSYTSELLLSLQHCLLSLSRTIESLNSAAFSQVTQPTRSPQRIMSKRGADVQGGRGGWFNNPAGNPGAGMDTPRRATAAQMAQRK